MKVTVYNFKGGVGKSTIALNYALSRDFGVVTNDIHNRIDRVMPEGQAVRLSPDKALPEFPSEFDIVFDLGGYIDHRAIAAIKQSNALIVPTVAEMAELETTIASLREISDYNNNILIVVNKAEKGDLELVTEILGAQGFHFPILPLKKSKALSRIRQHKSPLSVISQKNGLNRYVYGDAAEQFEMIIQKTEEMK